MIEKAPIPPKEPASDTKEEKLIPFDENETLPGLHWGQKVGREAEKAIGNLSLRLDTATLDAKAAKEQSHKLEMRSERLKGKYERIEVARDKRDNKIEQLKDPGKLLNRYAVTSWVNQGRIDILQLRNRFSNWRLGRAQDKLLDTNAAWKAAESSYTAADKRRLDFAERIEKRIQDRLDPIKARLGSVDARLSTLQASIQSVEEVAERSRQRLERLKALRGRASNKEELTAIETLMKPEQDALRLANEKLQRDLFPRLAKAHKHHERTTRAYIFATAAQEKIAARYKLHSHGTPESSPDPREHTLAASSGSGGESFSAGLAGREPAHIDLMALLKELFMPAKPTAKDVVEAWNKLNAYSAPIKDVDQLWEFAVEAGFDKDKVSAMSESSKAEFAGSTDDWKETFRTLVEKSPRFKALVAAAAPRGKSEAEFVEAFISSLHHA